MIAVEEAKEYVPFGREIVTAHPEQAFFPSAEDGSLQVLDPGVSLMESEGDEEWWEVRPSPREELYLRGNTVVWSRGGKIEKSFTLTEKVLQSLWCTFHSNPERPAILSSFPVPQEPQGAPLPSICIITLPSAKVFCENGQDFGVVKVFCENGQDFGVALQFSVRKCWSTKYGLLLERAARTVEDKEVPFLFCLLHPLDDFSRVVVRQSGRLTEWTDQSNTILFTSSDPSICVTYNSSSDTHSVWRVRRARLEEADRCMYGGPPVTCTGTPSVHSGTHSGVSGSFTPSNGSSRHSPTIAFTPVGLRNSHTPGHSKAATPGHSRGTSPLLGASRNGSPLSSMAGMLRGGQSPSLTSKLASRLASPSPRKSHSNSINNQDESLNEDKPLPPEVTLCLEHLWSEPIAAVKDNGGMATKVFLSKDTVGQTYLCLLSPATHLTIVKLELANDDKTKMIFGAVNRLPALDAISVRHLDMTLVLDPTGSLLLYSGTTKITKVLLNASPAALLSQEISALAIDSKPGTPFAALGSLPSTPYNVKRSSLLPTSRPPSAADLSMRTQFGNDSLSILSPVPGMSTPCRLLDPLPRQVTLCYTNGRMLQLTLPPVGGPLVTKALAAVKVVLPRELAVNLQSSWYSTRHAPGSPLSPPEEWNMFCKCLLTFAGYQVELLDLSSESDHGSPSEQCKRAKQGGTDHDWQYLLGSIHHQEAGTGLSRLLSLEYPMRDHSQSRCISTPHPTEGEVNPTSPLFSYIPSLLWSLHLLYEECKLDISLLDHLPPLASLLSRLAADLRLPEYQHHYWRDFPSGPPPTPRYSQLTQPLLDKLSPATGMTEKPPCIATHLLNILCDNRVTPFPLLSPIAPATSLLTTCLAGMSLTPPNSSVNVDKVLRPLSMPGRPTIPLPQVKVGEIPAHSVAQQLAASGWTRTRLASLPLGLVTPIQAALSICRAAPPPNWPPATYRLVGRDDLVVMNPAASSLNEFKSKKMPAGETDVEDGLEGLESSVSRMRWPKDQRLAEARRILQSSKPVTVAVVQRGDVSDHDFMEEQERHLLSLCVRTMALPIGRGVAALRTAVPLPTEPLSIPKLCLTGRAPPRGAKVELSHIDMPQSMEHWPCFHNGVAAGLRLSANPDSLEIDSTWICFNRPRNAEAAALTEHAGFLMSLGLNGHLANLGKLESFDYLMKGNEAISIGLLLGMAVARRGSMDVLVTKKLSTQLEALLPPTATELPLSHNTQVAALVGVGLLYSDTGHRHMAEVCLGELGRPPGPELENCVDRESYSLAAGLALGMITMGRGDALVAGVLADLNLPDTLHHHMAGGPRPPPLSTARERPPSYQIKEGDNINLDVTSPGATLALGMMYFKSGNLNIARWMEAPETVFLLEFVRPDLLLLRTLSKGLILWDSIEPSLHWVESHVPGAILPHCLVRPPDNPPSGLENLDYETLNQAYCNIIAGAAFVMSLRFAGSWNQAAFDTLDSLTSKLIAVSKRSIADLTGKAVIEQTICVLILSQGIVMAGSGDLSVLRTCRYLRSRVHNTQIVNYGSQMAVHLSVGLLFIGGGKLGLSTSPRSIAAMIAAFFPKFPTHSNDNRYHLQALRHLYVLAVEPRLIVPRCSDSNALVRCELMLEYRNTRWYNGPVLAVTAPTLLPELGLLSGVAVCDKELWPTTWSTKQGGWEVLLDLLAQGGNVKVKRKMGKEGKQTFHWGVSKTDRNKLLESKATKTYLEVFLRGCPPETVMRLESLLFSCRAGERPELLPVWTSLLSTNLNTPRSSFLAHQIRFLVASARQQSVPKLSSRQSPPSARQTMSTPAPGGGRPRMYSTPADGVPKHVTPNWVEDAPKHGSTNKEGSSGPQVRTGPSGLPFLVPELAVSLMQTGAASMDRLADKETGRLGTMLRNYMIGCQLTGRPGHQSSVSQERSQALASYLSLNNIDPVKRKDGEIEKDLKNPIKLNSLLKRSQTPASLFRMINS